MDDGNSSAWIYWVVVMPYMGLLIGIGLWTFRYQKRQKTSTDEHDDFWISKRNNSSILVACSITAGWLLLGFLTWAMYNTYMFGLGGIWVMVVPWAVLLFGMVIMVRTVRSIKAISQPQMLQSRFGLVARIMTTPFNIFCFVLWGAAEIWTVALYLAPEFGVQPWVLYFVFALPVAVYMALGGFRAVISANFLQFFMGIGFMTIILGSIVYLAWENLPQGQSMGEYLGSITPPGSPQGTNALSIFSLGVPLAIVSLAVLTPGWIVLEDWWLKVQSAKTFKEARRSMWLNLLFQMIWIVIVPSIIGILALVLYPPDQFDKLLGGDGYALMPTFLSEYFPQWALIIVFCLLAAHAVATISTYANLVALNGSYDFLQPLLYRRLGWSDAKVVLAGRWANLVAVLAILGVTFLIDLFPNGLWDLYYMTTGLITIGVGIPVFAMLWKRANLTGVAAGSIIGGLSTVAFFFIEKYVTEYRYEPDWLAFSGLGYVLVGALVGIVAFFIGTYVAPKPSQEQLDAIAANPVDDHEEFFAGVHTTY